MGPSPGVTLGSLPPEPVTPLQIADLGIVARLKDGPQSAATVPRRPPVLPGKGNTVRKRHGSQCHVWSVLRMQMRMERKSRRCQEGRRVLMWKYHI